MTNDKMSTLLNQTKYPAAYRQKDVKVLIKNLISFQPVTIIGLPRVGITRISRFLFVHPEFLEKELNSQKLILLEIDINDLFSLDETNFWQLVLKRIADNNLVQKELPAAKDLYLTAAQANDAFTFFDNTKQVVEKLCLQDYCLFFFFNRFNRTAPLYSFRFFAHFQALKDVAKTKINFLFTSSRPIEHLFPDVFKGANLEVFSRKYYLKPHSKKDLSAVIQEFENSRKIKLNSKIKEIAYRYSGGHSQYALLILQALEKQNFQLKNIDVALKGNLDLLAQSQEIWDFLNQKEKEILTGQRISSQNHFLNKIGLINEKKLLNPIFEDFVKLKTTEENQKIYDLTKKEKALLLILEGKRGETVPRDELITFVWQSQAEETNNWALDQLIKRLRGKIKLLNLPYKIVTVRGQGYKLIT